MPKAVQKTRRRSRDDGHIRRTTSSESTNINPENNYPNLDPKQLEKTWAKEIFDQPKDERESLLNELHGVSSRAVPESPGSIASALNLFQDAVDMFVPEYEKQAYHKACSMNSTYVHSVDFRLKFLRAELFHPRKAALRYVRNLDFLLDKFGDFALMRQLYMSDLNSEEIKFFKKGFMQILPFRDRAGRRVVANLGSFGGFDFSMETKERVGAYVNFAIISEDVTTQRKGAVALGLLTEEAIGSTQITKYSDFQRFSEAMPMRVSASHTCFPDDFRFRFLKALLLTLVQGEIRLMTRIHIGTQMECDYKLRSFGIPTEFIPRSFTGSIKNNYHKTFLKTRLVMDKHRKAEASGDYRQYYSSNSDAKPFPGIECPEVNCFLVRKNGVVWNNPGNIEFRYLLEEKENENKRLQEEYINSIAEEITARNIQILIFDENNLWYTKATKEEDIRKHVLQVMRDIRKRKNVLKNQPQSIKCFTNKFQELDGQTFKGDGCRVNNVCKDEDQEMKDG